MRIIAYRGEKKLADLVDKAYADLTPARRKAAEAALLKANPQLKSLARLKSGTVLTIPEVPGARVRPRKGQEGPDDEIRAVLAEQLAAFGERMAKRHEAHQADLKEQLGLLKDRQLKKAIGEDPALQELSAAAAAKLRTEAKEAAASGKNLAQALERLAADLAEG
jgi:hypothetical protein